MLPAPIRAGMDLQHRRTRLCGTDEGQESCCCLHQRHVRAVARLRIRLRLKSTYFEDWLRLIGITDITRARVQPTILNPTLTGQLLTASRWSAEAGATFS